MRPAVCLESLGLPVRAALDRAGPLGARAFQFEARGELAPARLSGTGRAELASLARSRQLGVAGLACGLRRGLATLEDQQRRMDHAREVVRLAADLGSNRVVVEAGQVPEDLNGAEGDRLLGALGDLASLAGRHGVMLALASGLESGEALAGLLSRLDSEWVGVSFDPAAQVVGGFPPLGDLACLAGRLGSVVAADARRARAGRAARRLPLGEGEIDWIAMLESLRDCGYTGWLVVDGSAGAAGVEAAADLATLTRLMDLAGV